MHTFLRQVLAVFVGLFLFSIISFFILFVSLGIGITYFSKIDGKSGRVSIKDSTVLELRLGGYIEEYVEGDELQDFVNELLDQKSLGLFNIIDALGEAAKDDRVQALAIYLEGPALGLGKREELYRAIQDFKAANKSVYVYTRGMRELDYYLATLGDTIMMHQQGYFDFNGLELRTVHFRKALDKLRIQPRIFRAEEYKSAAESFSQAKMSAENREQIGLYLTTVYDDFLSKVADNRDKTVAQLRALAQAGTVLNATQALEQGLITQTGYTSDFTQLLDSVVHLQRLSLEKYARNASRSRARNRVAVLVADGIITDQVGDRTITTDRLTDQLQDVRANDKIKAVVLRINSPGGSALASDELWYEIRKTAAKKPVIASMSDVAASGGYYLAMACDKIVAYPNTLTGSIGVILMYLEVDDFANEYGITFDTLRTGPFADIGNPFRDITTAEEQRIQQEVLSIYDVFVSKAAQSRGMTPEALRVYAKGRIWSGAAALENKLVDANGYLQDAIDLAAKQADVEKYSVVYYPREQKWDQWLRKARKGVFTSSLINQWIPAEWQQVLKQAPVPGQMELRMPYTLTIQ